MSDVIDAPDEAEPELIEGCELCGCAIEDLEELVYLLAADLVTQWELADSRDAWRHTGEAPPPEHVRNGPLQAARPRSARPHCPAASTIEEFFCVAGLEDPRRIAAWLLDHPLDAPHLHKLWKQKCTAPR